MAATSSQIDANQHEPDRPVTVARARVSMYADKVTGEVSSLIEVLGGVLEQLRIIGDPETTALQIDAVTAEAEQRIAEASARAARAEADRRTAEQEREEADAAADEASALAAEMASAAELATAGQATAVADLDAAEQRHLVRVEQLTLDVAAAHDAKLAQQERAAAAEQVASEQAIRLAALSAELAGARESHLEQVQQFNDRLAAARTDTAAQQLRAGAAERDLSESTVRAATLAAELGAAQQRLADQTAHTDTRMADQRSIFEERIAELRAELEQTRDRQTKATLAEPTATPGPTA